MRNIRIASMLCMAVFAAAAHAGPGDWTGQGPFGGNVVSVKADPLVPTRVYAATTNGFFRSDDAGASWASAETGLLTPHPTNGVFAVSGTAAGTLYLFDDTGRLYASADGGNSWTPTGFTLGYDLVQYQSGIAVAAGGGGTVWVAANSAGLLVSNNSGATFAPALGFPNAAGNAATNVSIKPGDPQRIIVGGAGALCNAASGACPIYVSSNGGGTWTPTANPDGQTHVGIQRQPLSISWGPGGNVYAYYNDPLAGSGKLLHSTTNGDAWAVGIDAGSISGAIAASPADANTIYAASFSGPLVSTNGGVTFAPLAASGLTTNGIYRPAVQSLAAASDFATSHRLWAGTVAAGMYLSNDSGATFSATSDGMTATSIRALAVHPLDNTRVYAGFGDSLTDPSQAFFRSLASGTWTASNTGLRAYQLRSIYIDPTTTGTVGSTVIYAAGSGFDSAPHVTNDRNSGVYKSVDGGLTWTTQNGGFPVSGAGHFAGNRRTIIADPRSCDARGPTAALCTTGPLQTLFVTGGGLPGPANTHPYRVMKSLDAGATWADSSAGLPNDVVGPDCTFDGVGGVTPIVMDPTNSSVLYIGAFSGEATDALCNVVTPHAATGVYKSTDGGANWVLMSNGLPTYDNTTTSVLETLSLAIDPAHPQTLWVSTKNLSTDVGAPGEIY
ncbi:MAG TPA: hypothetical protein VF132_13245, partial [Rudaea sp.]